jgi:peroxiredoxin
MIRTAMIVVIGFTARISGQTAPVDSAALVKVGQVPPDFSVTTLDGRVFTPAGAKGSVVLLNFFATWCTACKMELPELQKNIRDPFRNRGLVVLCIGREHSREDLEKFRRENGYTLDFAPDPDRGIYGKFAARNIPRNILIGKDGTILYQSLGYSPEEFKALVDRVAEALKK